MQRDSENGTKMPVETEREYGARVMTTSELLAYAAARNYDITPDVLERLYESGCLPRPIQRHVVGQPGSVAEYPPEAADQLLALCRLREHEKRYAYLCVRIWLEGYPVPFDALRSNMQRIIGDLWRGIGRLLIGKEDSLAKAERVAMKVQSQLERNLKQHDNVVARILNRVQTAQERFRLLVMLFQLALGGRPPFAWAPMPGDEERSLPALFIAALGLEAAQIDRAGEVPPWLPKDITPDLERLSKHRLLSLTRPRKRLARATERELLRARADYQALFGALPRVVRAMETIAGSNPFGFGLLAEFSSEKTPTEVQVMFVIAMLLARDVGFGNNIDTIAATAYELVDPLERQADLMRALQVDAPEIAAALKAGIQALRSGEKQSSIEERLRAQAPQFAAQFETFWAQHPDLAAYFGPQAPEAA